MFIGGMTTCAVAVVAVKNVQSRVNPHFENPAVVM
jgi:hypothetical protein